MAKGISFANQSELDFSFVFHDLFVGLVRHCASMEMQNVWHDPSTLRHARVPDFARILVGDATEKNVTINLRPIVGAILDKYSLPIHGIHGVVHWARVLENGIRLSEETGATLEVVSLFAIFHDSRRFNEGHDPDHGQRGADFAAEIRGSLFELSDHNFNLLYRACSGHTHERTHPDITIQTCWDSDRLDLGRVGITPHASRLCTEVAKREGTIAWADGRAEFDFVPELVTEDWGIALPTDRY